MFQVFLLLRPYQWVKNTFIFLPLFFGGLVYDFDLLLKSIIAFFAYSFSASSIYCFNDIWDVESDKQHPKKKNRPIAKGTISKGMAYVIMFISFIISIVITLVGFDKQAIEVLSIILFYWLLNIAYCIILKHIALIDVFTIAIGFVLRIILGGVATGIILSHWIIIMTFLLALFLAFAKRRDDVVMYENTGVKVRKNVNRYNIDFMNQAITIVATITVIAYIMYTVSPDVVARIKSPYLYMTSIFVLLGIMRYLQLTIVDIKSGSPTKVLMKDHFVQSCIIGWILTFIFILYV